MGEEDGALGNLHGWTGWEGLGLSLMSTPVDFKQTTDVIRNGASNTVADFCRDTCITPAESTTC